MAASSQVIQSPTTASGDAAATGGSVPASDEVLRVRDLRYTYPSGLEAVGGISFSLGKGEVLSVVGPSGSGKSTLLSLIAGLVAPDSGSIGWIDDQAVTRAKDRQRLAMLFQRDTVLPWRTVEKNIHFGMECLSIPKAERASWTDTLLKIGGLEQARDLYPRSLSGGMRRRLGLLMALAVRPELLLLDEPFSALDEPTRVGLSSDVLKLAYEYGVSVILVTHDLGEAISVSDRILVVSKRPATVQMTYKVDFGHDRDVFSLRERPEYAALYSELWHQVWSANRDEHDGAPAAETQNA